jgi:outer membrane lipoprotein-sorting protein
MSQFLPGQTRKLCLTFVFLAFLCANASKADSPAKTAAPPENLQVDALFEQVSAAYQKINTLRLSVASFGKTTSKPPRIEKSQSVIMFQRPGYWRVETTTNEKSKPESIFVADGSNAFTVSKGEADRKTGNKYKDSIATNIGLLYLIVLPTDIPGNEPDDPNVQIEYQPARLVEGEELEGIRVRSRPHPSINFSAEDTYWFDTKTHFWRRQQTILSVKGIAQSVVTLRVLNQEQNIKFPPDTFLAPAPFERDEEDPAASALLKSAKDYYRSLSSVEARFSQKELHPIQEWHERKEFDTRFWYRRPNFMRLDYNPPASSGQRRLFIDSNGAYIDEGSVIYRDNLVPGADLIKANWIDYNFQEGAALRIVRQMLNGDDLLAPFKDRSHNGISDFDSFSLRLLPSNSSQHLAGVQLRVNHRTMDNFEETTIWFDTKEHDKPILRSVQYRFEDTRPRFKAGRYFLVSEDITSWKINGDLPEALFRPAPTAYIKN